MVPKSCNTPQNQTKVKIQHEPNERKFGNCFRPNSSHLVSSSVAVFIFQFWMDRFVVKDPRVAAAYKRRRAVVIDLAAAHEAAEASRKKRQAAEVGLMWPLAKRVGGGRPDRRWLYQQAVYDAIEKNVLLAGVTAHPPVMWKPGMDIGAEAQEETLVLALKDEGCRQTATVKLEAGVAGSFSYCILNFICFFFYNCYIISIWI